VLRISVVTALSFIVSLSAFQISRQDHDQNQTTVRNETITFRAGKSDTGPVVEITIGKVVFVAPSVTFRDTSWAKGEMVISNGRVEWRDARHKMIARGTAISLPENGP